MRTSSRNLRPDPGTLSFNCWRAPTWRNKQFLITLKYRFLPSKIVRPESFAQDARTSQHMYEELKQERAVRGDSASDSDVWSEPDRKVSSQRIGLDSSFLQPSPQFTQQNYLSTSDSNTATELPRPLSVSFQGLRRHSWYCVQRERRTPNCFLCEFCKQVRIRTKRWFNICRLSWWASSIWSNLWRQSWPSTATWTNRWLLSYVAPKVVREMGHF